MTISDYCIPFINAVLSKILSFFKCCDTNTGVDSGEKNKKIVFLLRRLGKISAIFHPRHIVNRPGKRIYFHYFFTSTLSRWRTSS